MQIDRLLITGAAGALGRVLRTHMQGRYKLLRLSDVAPMDPAGPGEEVVRCDLGDAAAMDRLFEGIQACVHLGGQSVEGDWPTVLHANIIGLVNTWEAARKAGTKRMLFASSNHAIGFTPFATASGCRRNTGLLSYIMIARVPMPIAAGCVLSTATSSSEPGT